MGLDQYLYARRHVDAGTAELVLKSAKRLTRFDDEGEYYLPMWDHGSADIKATARSIIDIAGLAPMMGEESNSGRAALDGTWVSVVCSYWRKANAIHAWFVDNCQDGVDECQESEPVHPEQLAQLAITCEQALAAYQAGRLNEAQQLMTPRPGFFFGGTDLDEYWAENMAWTAAELRRVVNAAIAVGNVEFVYQSSW